MEREILVKIRNEVASALAALLVLAVKGWEVVFKNKDHPKVAPQLKTIREAGDAALPIICTWGMKKGLEEIALDILGVSGGRKEYVRSQMVCFRVVCETLKEPPNYPLNFFTSEKLVRRLSESQVEEAMKKARVELGEEKVVADADDVMAILAELECSAKRGFVEDFFERYLHTEERREDRRDKRRQRPGSTAAPASATPIKPSDIFDGIGEEGSRPTTTTISTVPHPPPKPRDIFDGLGEETVETALKPKGGPASNSELDEIVQRLQEKAAGKKGAAAKALLDRRKTGMKDDEFAEAANIVLGGKK